MIKIIKEGQKEFYGKCRRCGCEFSYEIEDICVDYVTCPDCGYIYGWEHMDHSKTHLDTDTEYLLQKLISMTTYGMHVKSDTEKNSFGIPVDTNGVKPL